MSTQNSNPPGSAPDSPDFALPLINEQTQGGSNVLASRVLFLGYLLLFAGALCFDQATKYHAEHSFLTWSDAHDLRSYRSSRERLGTLGTSPASLRDLTPDLSGSADAQLRSKGVSAAWLDFNLTYVRNPGAAWGSFSTAPARTRLWLFYAVTFCVSALIVYLFCASHPGQRLTRGALVLILSGAAGNLFDRLSLQYVIDWIHLHWRIFGWEYSFPVFNWADVCINIGIALMVADVLLQEKAIKIANKSVIKMGKGVSCSTNEDF